MTFRARSLAAAGTALLVSLGLPLLPAVPVAAAPTTFYVTTISNTGPGSLDQAVLDANANPGADTIKVMVDPVGPTHEIVITEAVTIDGCRNDGDTTTPYWSVLSSGNPPTATIVVDSADVRIQGLAIAGGQRPIDVTANGDRFTYVGGYLYATSARLRVTGARDVTIGGPLPCEPTIQQPEGPNISPVSLFVLAGTFGLELIDTIDATVEYVLTDTTVGEAVVVTGGTGTRLIRNDLQLAHGGPIIDGVPHQSVVRLQHAGTAASPVRLYGGSVHHCTGDCIAVEDNSYLDIGDPTMTTSVRRNFYHDSLIRFVASSGHVHDTDFFYGDVASINLDGGSHDVLIERNGFYANSGPLLIGGAPAPANTVIRANLFGYIPARFPPGSPTLADNSAWGIRVSSAAGIMIGGPAATDGNLISANRDGGVLVESAAADVDIANNLIGTDQTGNLASPNGGNGIVINAPQSRVDGNTVSGNSATGILVGVAADHVAVRGNRVGLQLTGGSTLGNAGDGIFVSGTSTLVDGNIVGGNGGHGIVVAGIGSTVSSNIIGSDDTFSSPVPNVGAGIFVVANSVDVAGNTIGAHSTGLLLAGTGAVVSGNHFGARPDGTPVAALGNAIAIDVVGDANVIGVPVADPSRAGNVITGTIQTDGAVVVRGMHNTIHANSIFLNAGHGIDLFAKIPKPNEGIAAPNPLSAVVAGSVVDMTGQLGADSTLGPWVVDLYASQACGRPDHEGELYLGQLSVTNGDFSGTVPVPPDGFAQLTATATDAVGDTSEFSSCQLIEGVPATTTTTTTSTPPGDTTPSSSGSSSTDATGGSDPSGGPGGTTVTSTIAAAGGQSPSDTTTADGVLDPTLDPNQVLPETGAASIDSLLIALALVVAGIAFAASARARER